MRQIGSEGVMHVAPLGGQSGAAPCRQAQVGKVSRTVVQWQSRDVHPLYIVNNVYLYIHINIPNTLCENDGSNKQLSFQLQNTTCISPVYKHVDTCRSLFQTLHTADCV